MKRALLLVLLTIPIAITAAQARQADDMKIVEDVKFEGESDEQKLSTALRDELHKLAGRVYDAEAARQLAERIQIELPDLAVEVKTQPGKQPNQIRLIFEAKTLADYISKNDANARYTVESVQIEGIPRSKVSDPLYADMQTMVGKSFDSIETQKLVFRLQFELRIDGEDVYAVSKKIRRGTMPDRVQIQFHVEKPANSYGFSFNNPGYHSKQGFSVHNVETGYQRRDLGRIAFHVRNDANELLERQAGIGFSYSNRIDHLKFKIDYSSLRAQWTPETQLASSQNPTIPGIYRLRDTLAPSAEFNVSKNLKIGGGVSFSELQLQDPVPHFQKANTVDGSFSYARNLGDSHQINGSYSIETAARSIGSDFVYTRHWWTGEYSFDPSAGQKTVSAGFFGVQPANQFKLSVLGGRITGNAPLFERFSLGNIQTLKGWNKFDISPLGGSRAVQFEASYRHTWLSFFYDTGTVWDQGQAITFRHSVGVTTTLAFANLKICRTLGFLNPICWPITVGVPVRRSNVEPIFAAF
jgi:outer membrane protein assembly factor BamA